MGDLKTPKAYTAEFVDGPLAGTAERRESTDGAFESPLDTFIAVEGLPTLLRYLPADARKVSGGLIVRYHFDETTSDPYRAEDEDTYRLP